MESQGTDLQGLVDRMNRKYLGFRRFMLSTRQMGESAEKTRPAP